eukprot:359831-Chlamydomonas_euryale.AAC.3
MAPFGATRDAAFPCHLHMPQLRRHGCHTRAAHGAPPHLHPLHEAQLPRNLRQRLLARQLAAHLDHRLDRNPLSAACMKWRPRLRMATLPNMHVLGAPHGVACMRQECRMASRCAWRSMSRRSSAWHGVACRCMAQRSSAWRSTAARGVELHGAAWRGVEQHCSDAWHGATLHGMARHSVGMHDCMAVHRMARHSMGWVQGGILFEPSTNAAIAAAHTCSTCSCTTCCDCLHRTNIHRLLLAEHMPTPLLSILLMFHFVPSNCLEYAHGCGACIQQLHRNKWGCPLHPHTYLSMALPTRTCGEHAGERRNGRQRWGMTRLRNHPAGLGRTTLPVFSASPV